MLTLESMAPLMMLNALLFTLLITRKEGKFMMFAKSIGNDHNDFSIINFPLGICSFTYLGVVFYGEEQVFYQNCLRDDVIGYYLREKYLRIFSFFLVKILVIRYLSEMEGHKYYEKFLSMEDEFRKKYGTRSNEDIQTLLKNNAVLVNLKK